MDKLKKFMEKILCPHCSYNKMQFNNDKYLLYCESCGFDCTKADYLILASLRDNIFKFNVLFELLQKILEVEKEIKKEEDNIKKVFDVTTEKEKFVDLTKPIENTNIETILN